MVTPPSSPGDSLSPELRLLVRVSHPLWNVQDGLKDNALERVDLDVLVQLAHEHGLSSLLYSRLYAVSSSPAREQLSALRTSAIASTQQALILAGEMWRLVPLLQANALFSRDRHLPIHSMAHSDCDPLATLT